MVSFVDQMRAGNIVQKQTETVRAWGFDPDLRNVGWGVIVAEVGPHKIKPLYYRGGIIQADELKLLSLSQVASMVKAITRWQRPLDMRLSDDCTEHVIVEGQQFYSKSRVDANDLLRLAQITGALQIHLTDTLRKEPEVVLPKVWKGQKKKEGMHRRCMEWLAGLGDVEGMERKFGDSAQHLLDALCMAKWKLET